jgi:hypothetical protein
MPFDGLPIEIVLSIFECLPTKYLPPCAAVSQLWKALVIPLIWQSVSITLHPHTEDPLVMALKQRLIDVNNFKYTTTLTLTCELVVEDVGPPTKVFKQIRERTRDFRLVRDRITHRRTSCLKYLKIVLFEPAIDSIPVGRGRWGVIDRVVNTFGLGIPLFVTALSRNRDGLQLDVQYSDVRQKRLQEARLFPLIFSLKEKLTIATLRSDEFTTKWIYPDISLPRLRTLILDFSPDYSMDRTVLTWVDFRGTGIQSLCLNNFSLPTALNVPETLTKLRIIETGTPVNALLISLFSLPNLENLEVNQSQWKIHSFRHLPHETRVYHQKELLSRPIVSTNLRTLKLSKCLYHPEIIYRLALECPNLKTIRLLLVDPGSFLIRHITSAATVPYLELDPYYRRYDYWDAFFRGFGSGFGHVLFPIIDLWKYSISNRDQRWWELRKVSKRPSHGKIFVRVVSNKLQVKSIRQGVDNYAQEQQEWLEKEGAKGRIMYWEFKQD